MFNIVFPSHTNQRYYGIHFQYLLNIFKYLKCNISFYERNDDSIVVKIDDKEFDFNYWDDSNKYSITDNFSFKFHCKEMKEKVTPFSPISFYDWEQYYRLEKEIEYNPKDKVMIGSRQRPYCGALERRIRVQHILKTDFGATVLTELINQEDYWKEISRIKVAVFVPGQNNNMLDRGHIQYMAFGCCTISPNLPELLPSIANIYEGYHCRAILPDKHYIQCKDDYSDLSDIICRLSDDKCKEIGDNAKKLFQETSTPEVLGEWIKKHL
jgi:hypothetical protein